MIHLTSQEHQGETDFEEKRTNPILDIHIDCGIKFWAQSPVGDMEVLSS